MPRCSRATKLFLATVAAVLIVRASVVDWCTVAGTSMEPTLHNGDVVVCQRFAYGLRLPLARSWCMRWRDPELGDIVLLHAPDKRNLCIKRVVSPPAGQPLGDNEVWVQGDNTNGSRDSRSYGPVPIDNILGRAMPWKSLPWDMQPEGTSPLSISPPERDEDSR